MVIPGNHPISLDGARSAFLKPAARVRADKIGVSFA